MKLGGCVEGYNPEGNLFLMEVEELRGRKNEEKKKKKRFGDGREEKKEVEKLSQRN